MTMTKARAWILAAVLILLWAAVPDGPATATLPDTSMPRCPEDAVLVGVGSFEQGRWTEYTCGPAVDDYMLPDTSTIVEGE